MIGTPIRDRRRAKKEKRTKKERKLRKGKLVETAAAEEIVQGGLRQHFLDDFHRCLENPAGFPTVTTSSAAVTSAQINWRRQSRDSVAFLGEAIRREKVIVAGQ